MNYTVTNRRGPFPSKSNSGSDYWTVSFKNDANETFTTYIDTAMENFHYWHDILHSKQPLIVGNLKLKSKKDRIINADSEPRIIGVQEVKAAAKYTPPATNTFNSLFE